MRIKDLITSRVCGNTVFEDSWLWYCDECRQHGTAMSAEEAEYLAEQHAIWRSSIFIGEDKDNTDDEDNWVSYREASDIIRLTERDEFMEMALEMCPLFIIDEGNNITYSYGEDYTDKTPNKVTDIETMIKLQKDLGLE